MLTKGRSHLSLSLGSLDRNVIAWVAEDKEKLNEIDRRPLDFPNLLRQTNVN
jgi:hypothetical protein